MGNSKRPEGSVAKGKKEKKNIKAQTVADAGATARGAIAITRNGLEAANGIHVRALKQRDASRAEAAEVKSSLGAVSRQMHDQTMECSPTDQPVRNFKDNLGINMTIKTSITFTDLVNFWYPYSSTSMERGLRRVVPQRRSRLMPSRTHSSNLHVI